MKPQTVYRCAECQTTSRKWSGKCDTCGAWNAIHEVAVSKAEHKLTKALGGARPCAFVSLDGPVEDAVRMLSGIGEFDRVTGGGLVPGSAVLIGGEPGIGKSTLLLQVCDGLARAGYRTAYTSGEESVPQIRRRAKRLGVERSGVMLSATADVSAIVAAINNPETRPDMLVVDSIQTLIHPAVESAPGSVSQVRAAVQELVRAAKESETTLILVGHVTKEGALAGPKSVEHLTDAVLGLDADQSTPYRLLRASKNRFGPAQELGVFEMQTAGMVEVASPSAIFIANRASDVAGSVVFASLEGTRPMLVEIQALLSPNNGGSPRRVVVGWDNARLAMVLAVIEARLGITMSRYDVFLNVAGGYRIGEAAADLAVATALLSSLTNECLPPEMVVMGEIGLGGEIRPVPQLETRLKETTKLGFTKPLIPAGGQGAAHPNLKGLVALRHLREILPLLPAIPNSSCDLASAA